MIDGKMSLEEYIEALLKQGKRGGHEDFKVLFEVFGKERISKMAKVILDDLKAALTEKKGID